MAHKDTCLCHLWPIYGSTHMCMLSWTHTHDQRDTNQWETKQISVCEWTCGAADLKCWLMTVCRCVQLCVVYVVLMRTCVCASACMQNVSMFYACICAFTCVMKGGFTGSLHCSTGFIASGLLKCLCRVTCFFPYAHTTNHTSLCHSLVWDSHWANKIQP